MKLLQTLKSDDEQYHSGAHTSLERLTLRQESFPFFFLLAYVVFLLLRSCLHGRVQSLTFFLFFFLLSPYFLLLSGPIVFGLVRDRHDLDTFSLRKAGSALAALLRIVLHNASSGNRRCCGVMPVSPSQRDFIIAREQHGVVAAERSSTVALAR